MTDTTTTPSVLFVCVHNAGRSQMAAGFLRDIAGDRIEVRSAGSMPASSMAARPTRARRASRSGSSNLPKGVWAQPTMQASEGAMVLSVML